MIVFLNFAPIEYLGGAERKIYELFKETKKYEKSKLITVSPKITNIYSSLVLGLNFENRSKTKLDISKDEGLSLSPKCFIPFTKENKLSRGTLLEARAIYFKADLTEIFILLYFGGFRILSKSVAGIMSPWVYSSPLNFWDNLHNLFYKSTLLKLIMQRSSKVHVLSNKDYKYFYNTLGIKNAVLIPNYSHRSSSTVTKEKNKKELQIIFVGELIKRKGVDILIDVIINSPNNFKFNIVGKGPMREEIIKTVKSYDNCKYWGYLEKKELDSLYATCDVLLLPSRAEGFAGVIPEAISHGLKIIDSSEIGLDMPRFIESTVKQSTYQDYIKALRSTYEAKKANDLQNVKIIKYFNENYSDKVILPKLVSGIFDITR